MMMKPEWNKRLHPSISACSTSQWNKWPRTPSSWRCHSSFPVRHLLSLCTGLRMRVHLFSAHCILFSLIQYFASLIRMYLLDCITLHLHLFWSHLRPTVSALFISCTVICCSFPSASFSALFLSMTHIFVEEEEQLGSVLRRARLKWNGPLSAVHTYSRSVWWGACGGPSTHPSPNALSKLSLSTDKWFELSLSPCAHYMSSWWELKHIPRGKCYCSEVALS